jgi:hypothetical protein
LIGKERLGWAQFSVIFMTFLHELYSNYRERDLLCQNKKTRRRQGKGVKFLKIVEGSGLDFFLKQQLAYCGIIGIMSFEVVYRIAI